MKPVSDKMSKINVIIDTDCGCDDLLAIGTMYLSNQVHIHMITNVHGMTSVPIANNILKTLFQDDDIKNHIFPGCFVSTIPERTILNENWGCDYQTEHNQLMNAIGLNNTTFHNICETEDNIHKIANQIEQIGSINGKCVYICLGPLTNIYHLLKYHHNIMQQYISKFVIMGGAVNVSGNINNDESEVNFYLDSIAAHYVFANCLIPIELFDLSTANTDNGERLNLVINKDSDINSKCREQLSQLLSLNPMSKAYDTIVSYAMTHYHQLEFEDILMNVDQLTGKCIVNTSSSLLPIKLAKKIHGEMMWNL